jgi:hypothetical protein
MLTCCSCACATQPVCPCAWGQLRGSLAVAVPADACVVNVSAVYKGAFVLVQRGGCHFAIKAKNMQRAGCAVTACSWPAPVYDARLMCGSGVQGGRRCAL